MTSTPEIYDDLKDQLVTARIAPGSKLKPAALQGRYGCSANTLRDVLLRLTSIGLVDFEMQRGFRARASSRETRADIARFRVLLEQEGAQGSMERGGLRWEAQLSAAHHKLSHIESQIAVSGDIQPHLTLWSDAEWEFHETLVSACGSPVLISTYTSVYLQFRQQMVAQERGFDGNYFNAVIAEHQAIVDAALSRNVAACRQAIHDHLQRNF